MTSPTPVRAAGVEPVRRAMEPGQALYEADVAARPNYHDGTPRRTWAQLESVFRASWAKGELTPSKDPSHVD